MFAFRPAMGWGLSFLLMITPALAQSIEDSEPPLRPFHDLSVASFDDVWREPISRIERPIAEEAQYSIERVAAEQTVIPPEEAVAATLSVADWTIPLPTLTTQPLATLPPSPSPADTIIAAQFGLFQWLLKILGFVGLVAFGGGYWVYRVRPALDVRHTTSRLRLSSALSLPRRAGLFLVDVEDQTVLVAMDGGGIRQVIPLGLLASMKTTRRRAATHKAQSTSSSPLSEGNKTSEPVTFHDVFQEHQALGRDVRAVLSSAKFATSPLASAAHPHKAS